MVNRQRLLWAGFMAILAAGLGAAIRGSIFATWGTEFNFTGTELGLIGGAGFTGFCFGIIIGGIVADKIGYGKLVVAAFLFHVVSAIVTFMATKGQAHDTSYNFLFWGIFIFAVANGTLEAVANPLVATLFPENRTHYLNILHASWPLGLIIGAAAGALLGDSWTWKQQLALYLVPTLAYGVMFFGQTFPKSEASEKGLSLGEMFKDVGILGGLVICGLLALFMSGVFTQILGLVMTDKDAAAKYGPYIAYAVSAVLLLVIGVITKFSLGAVLLFALFIAHALVGSVELGTEQWIQNITGNLLDPVTGKWLLVYTSAIMFALRFCAHFIEKNLKLSPVALLLVCAILACIGLNLVSGAQGLTMVMLALAVYSVGKTFFWPTMLAVASDRFPRTGAVAISIMGGIGMMSAGLIGSPGLGYGKDRFAAEALKESNPALFESVKGKESDGKDKTAKFLPFILAEVPVIDPEKLGAVKEKLKKERETLAKAGITDPRAGIEKLLPDEKALVEADIQGDRKTLKADSFQPAAMAVLYLLILLYFMTIGGYKAVHIGAPDTDATQ